ncbi:hypothetical protein ACGK9U_11680 [Mariniflexile sp. HNIBRBA6329]|uniref:hypothetical protein n=1 Tax=Mariniflexile sp. HNIBRBA6329 TaxID=3373088 RepID=UPI0037457391
MRRDKIYEGLKFSTEFSVEDWNTVIKFKLRKYFTDNTIFEENKEVLRTELINFIKISEKPSYLNLFEWLFSLHADCIKIDKNKTIKVFADSFQDMTNTDMKWMTNVLTQPNYKEFSNRDKISYYFKVIDETLESVFKPRFKLLDKLVRIKLGQNIIDNSNFDFGKIIREFPNGFENEISLFLKDPIYSISTNQWRNIAAHKSYVIKKDSVEVKYGSSNIQSISMSIDEFYEITHWTQDIYRTLRLSQVFTDLNYIKEIIIELEGAESFNIRFESALLHIIHNMQIVGFEFVSTEELSDTFCLNVRGKVNHDLKSSLIHATQCLEKLSCAIYDDEFIRDNFENVRISIVDNESRKIASATIPIHLALKKIKNEIGLEEYLQKMKFEI